MRVDVVLRKRGNRYLTQFSNLPAIQVNAVSRDAALNGVAQGARDHFSEVELVRLDISEPHGNSPLLEQFGSCADDPTCDDWQDEMAVYRRECNEVPDKV